MFGVHYAFQGVICICGIGIYIFLTFRIWDGLSYISITKNVQIWVFKLSQEQSLSRSLWKKVRRLEKGTPPQVVRVVTIIRYADNMGQ